MFVGKQGSGKKWLVLVAAFLVAASGIAGILILHQWSTASRRVVELLTNVEGLANRLSALEWEATAQRSLSPELKQTHQLVRHQVERLFEELHEHAENEDVLAVRKAYREYASAIAEEFRLLEAKQFAAARRLDNDKVDPAYDALIDLIAYANIRSDSSSKRTLRAVDIGSSLVLILAALSLGLLVWKFERLQRASQLALAEQEVLRRSEARFRSLVQNASDVIAILNPMPPTIKFVSDSARRIVGYRPEDLMGTDIYKLIHPDDVAEMQRFLASCLGGQGSALMVELRFRCKDGHWSPIEIVGNNRVNDAAVDGLVINFRDITRRRQFEEVLAQQGGELASEDRKLH